MTEYFCPCISFEMTSEWFKSNFFITIGFKNQKDRESECYGSWKKYINTGILKETPVGNES